MLDTIGRGRAGGVGERPPHRPARGQPGLRRHAAPRRPDVAQPDASPTGTRSPTTSRCWPRTASTSAPRAPTGSSRPSPSPSARPGQRPAPCPDGPSSARCRRPSRSRTTSRRLLVSSSPSARASPSTRLVSRRCTPARPGQLVLGERDLDRGRRRAGLVRVQLGQRHDAAVDAHGPRDVGQLGHLAGEPVDHRDEDADQQAVDLRVLLAQLLELAPADHERLRRLDGLDRRPPHGGTVEEGLLAEEVAGAHERHGEGVAVRTADEHGDAPVDDHVERVARVALVDEVGAPAVLPPPAPLEERGARLLRQRGEKRRVGAHGRATLPSAHQCAVDVRTAP